MPPTNLSPSPHTQEGSFSLSSWSVSQEVPWDPAMSLNEPQQVPQPLRTAGKVPITGSCADRGPPTRHLPRGSRKPCPSPSEAGCPSHCPSHGSRHQPPSLAAGPPEWGSWTPVAPGRAESRAPAAHSSSGSTPRVEKMVQGHARVAGRFRRDSGEAATEMPILQGSTHRSHGEIWEFRMPLPGWHHNP